MEIVTFALLLLRVETNARSSCHDAIVVLFVEETIMVELKALIHLEDVHLAQAKNYLEAYQMKIGLLINFGAIKLEHKRVYNNKIIA